MREQCAWQGLFLYLLVLSVLNNQSPCGASVTAAELSLQARPALGLRDPRSLARLASGQAVLISDPSLFSCVLQFHFLPAKYSMVFVVLFCSLIWFLWHISHIYYII